MMEYTCQKKLNKHAGERQNPKEFKEIRVDS